MECKSKMILTKQLNAPTKFY